MLCFFLVAGFAFTLFFVVHDVLAMTNESVTAQPCVVARLSRLWLAGA